MCSKETLKIIIELTHKKMKSIFGDKLISVILFGSYARGNYDAESDIDIMAIVNMEKTELSKYISTVNRETDDIVLQYDVLISIILQSQTEFEEYKDVLPFFKNILCEGVKVGA